MFDSCIFAKPFLKALLATFNMPYIKTCSGIVFTSHTVTFYLYNVHSYLYNVKIVRFKVSFKVLNCHSQFQLISIFLVYIFSKLVSLTMYCNVIILDNNHASFKQCLFNLIFMYVPPFSLQLCIVCGVC